MPVYPASPAIEFSDGLSDRAVALWYLPTDLTHYLLGVDRQWGERRSFWDNVGMNYNSWHDPFDRPMHVVNGFVIGGVNFLSAGSLQIYTEFFRELSVFGFKNHPTLASLSNDFFRTAEIYMKPPARNAYEAGEWTFDVVFAVTATKATLEYQSWSKPITHRQKIVDEVALAQRQQLLARTQSLRQWAAAVGNGDIRAALPRLRDMAVQYPNPFVKGVNVTEQLAQGNRAMEALHALAAEYPEAMAWAADGHRVTRIAEGFGYSHVNITHAAKMRLMIAAQYAPEEAAAALAESVLARLTVPAGEYGAGQLLEHAASPQFELLHAWEAVPAMRPTVLKSYAMIGLNTDLLPVALKTAEGVVRFLPESSPMVLELLTDKKPIIRYATMRALALSDAALAALPADLATPLRTFPMKDYLILFGREQSPKMAVAIMERMLVLGNTESLHLMESLVEIAHPMAPRVLKSLCALRQKLPQHAERITQFITKVDLNIIFNEVIFNAEYDAALAKEHARLLGSLHRQGNAAAMDALTRLSSHEKPIVREIAGEQLVDMALEGAFPREQLEALLREAHPRIVPMLAYWSLKKPELLNLKWSAFCQVVIEADVFPPEAVPILRTQARLGNTKVGYVISQVLGSAVKYQQELLRILQDHPEVRKTVQWDQVMEVAQTSLQDIGFSFELLRLMVEEGKAVTVRLRDYEPQWFYGAANAGDPRGVAGLELLGMHGNSRAVQCLRLLADRKADRNSLINIPYLANQALENIPDADAAIAGVKKQPTVMLQVTALDLQTGRAAALAADVLKGRRGIASLNDLRILSDAAQKGVNGAVDAIYKVAWQGSVFAAEAKELLLRWSVESENPHRHTLQRMVRVLENKGAAGSESSVLDHVSPVEMYSVRHLETLITVSRDYAPMALDELIRMTRHHADVVYPILKRLFKSQDPRVLDLLSDRLIAAADQGMVDVELFNDILSTEGCQVGSAVLFTRMRFLLETTARSSPLEVFRDFVMSPNFRSYDIKP